VFSVRYGLNSYILFRRNLGVTISSQTPPLVEEEASFKNM
jgi:hypothetical protein